MAAIARKAMTPLTPDAVITAGYLTLSNTSSSNANIPVNVQFANKASMNSTKPSTQLPTPLFA
jgi:Na+/serine symporter